MMMVIAIITSEIYSCPSIIVYFFYIHACFFISVMPPPLWYCYKVFNPLHYKSTLIHILFRISRLLPTPAPTPSLIPTIL